MAKHSAGLLVFRENNGVLELFIVHPGGPFWARKDDGAWSFPKGEYAESEDPQEAARREFKEEIGQTAPDGELLDLGEIKQSSGKIVRMFAVQGNVDENNISSNTVEIDWPPRTGKKMTIPEVDRAMWATADLARIKLVKGQVGFVDRLQELL